MATILQNWNAPAVTPSVKQAADGTRTTIVNLLFLLGRLRIAHWQASTKTNEHQALGSLYDSIGSLIDDFAEILMGTEGGREMPTVSGPIGGGEGYDKIVEEMRTAALDLCKATQPDLANIAADILQAVNKARYLLS